MMVLTMSHSHKNSVFSCTTSDWNHLSDDQRKAPTLRTLNAWSPHKGPSNSYAHTMHLSHLYLRLGPVTYKTKIKPLFHNVHNVQSIKILLFVHFGFKNKGVELKTLTPTLTNAVACRVIPVARVTFTSEWPLEIDATPVLAQLVKQRTVVHRDWLAALT